MHATDVNTLLCDRLIFVKQYLDVVLDSSPVSPRVGFISVKFLTLSSKSMSHHLNTNPVISPLVFPITTCFCYYSIISLTYSLPHQTLHYLHLISIPHEEMGAIYRVSLAGRTNASLFDLEFLMTKGT